MDFVEVAGLELVVLPAGTEAEEVVVQSTHVEPSSQVCVVDVLSVFLLVTMGSEDVVVVLLLSAGTELVVQSAQVVEDG